MGKRIMSIIAMTAILFIAIMPTASFASNSQTNNDTTLIMDKNQASEINDGQKDDEAEQSVTDSVYGDNEQENDNQKDDGEVNDEQKDDGDVNDGQIDDATMNNVTDTLSGEKDGQPEDIISKLQGKNVAILDMLKAFMRLSEKNNGTGLELTDNTLESYADTLHEKIDNEKEKIVNLYKSLEKLSDLYDKVGELEKAIEVQKEAIKSDFKNLEGYKNLGEDLNKKGEKGVKAFVNGEQVNFDVQPVIEDGRTLVPIRAIAESLKSDVEWDPVEKTVTLSKDGIEIKLFIGQTVTYINNKAVKLDVPAEIRNGRTLLPVRFISEAFNSTVKWEPASKSVVIY